MAPSRIYALSLHDALPICQRQLIDGGELLNAELQSRIIKGRADNHDEETQERSEEHTSELQSRPHLVCRLLLEKKKRVGALRVAVNSNVGMRDVGIHAAFV